MWTEFWLAFVPIFVAVDPLGMLPFFMALTRSMDEPQRRRLVMQSTAVAAFVSMAFVLVGPAVFSWLGLKLSDFLVAGGAILLILSIRDLLSFDKGSQIPSTAAGVVPLAVPLMAGPAVMTTSLILVQQFGLGLTLASLAINLFLCGAVLRSARFFLRWLGEAGSHTLSKIASLFLAAIGVMLIRRGLETFLP